MRRLTLSNKGSVKQYLSRAQTLFYHHQINKKINRLKENWNHLEKDQRKNKLNKIDSEFISLLLSSEKKYRKLHARVIEYSLTLSKAELTWYFWRKLVHWKQSRFIDTNYILQTTSYLNILNPLSISYQQCVKELKQAKKTYQLLKKSHHEIQDTYVNQQNKRLDLKILYYYKKEKQRWYKLKRVFSKKATEINFGSGIYKR